MGTHLIDRLTSTLGFRVLFFMSAVLVLPVLALGLLVTSGSLMTLMWQREAVLEILGFAALSLGGAVGTLGWVLSLVAARDPERYNLTVILVCLVVGVVTAVAVTAYSIGQIFEDIDKSWGLRFWVPAFGVFGLATTIWALNGIGRMQLLFRRYRERTGRMFDAMPVVFLLVALGLAVAFVAVLVTL